MFKGLPGVLLLCAARNGETSHAGLYNDASYGNVYRNTMESSCCRFPIDDDDGYSMASFSSMV